MRSGSTFVRATSSRITNAARSSARTVASAPPQRPIGVRNASTTTTSRTSLIALLQPQNALGVAVEDARHDVVLVTQLAPLAQDALVRQTWVIAAEHDLVFQPRADIDFELRGEIFGCPAGKLPIHVALVQR